MNILQALTDKLMFDFSGNFASKLATWTEASVWETFERMMIMDDRVKGGMRIRKTKALAYPWAIVPFDESAQAQTIADAVTAMMTGLDLSAELSDVWNAIPFGYSLCEGVWVQREGVYTIKNLIGVHPKFVTQGINGALIKGTGVEIKTWDYPYQFLNMRFEPLFDNPEGSPVLAACYWPYIFKKLGMRFWGTLLEKFGIPSLVALLKNDGKFPLKAADGDDANTMTIGAMATMIVTELGKLKSGGNAALVDVDDVKVLEASGTGADYQLFQNECNNMISIAILGNTMTMDAQSRGSQALGTVHAQISTEVAEGDARFLSKAINSHLIRWFVDLNFGIDTPTPMFSWDFDGETSWDVVKDAMDRGVPVSLSAIYDKIRGYEPVDEADAFTVASTQSQAAEVGLSRPFPGSLSLPARKRTR